jgi:hypothetical protein
MTLEIYRVEFAVMWTGRYKYVNPVLCEVVLVAGGVHRLRLLSISFHLRMWKRALQANSHQKLSPKFDVYLQTRR